MAWASNEPQSQTRKGLRGNMKNAKVGDLVINKHGNESYLGAGMIIALLDNRKVAKIKWLNPKYGTSLAEIGLLKLA